MSYISACTSQVPIVSSGIEGKGRGVFARQPLQPRLASLPKSAPVLILFGDHDWLRPAGNGAEAFADAARASGVKSVTLETTEKAGHHLYLDNPDSFNAAVNRLFK